MNRALIYRVLIPLVFMGTAVVGAFVPPMGAEAATVKTEAAPSQVAASTDIFVMLTQYGPLGLVVIGFLTGYISPGSTTKAKDTEIARLQGLLEDKLVPMANQYAVTLADATRALSSVAPIIDRSTQALERASEILENARRDADEARRREQG